MGLFYVKWEWQLSYTYVNIRCYRNILLYTFLNAFYIQFPTPASVLVEIEYRITNWFCISPLFIINRYLIFSVVSIRIIRNMDILLWIKYIMSIRYIKLKKLYNVWTWFDLRKCISKRGISPYHQQKPQPSLIAKVQKAKVAKRSSKSKVCLLT